MFKANKDRLKQGVAVRTVFVIWSMQAKVFLQQSVNAPPIDEAGC